MMGEFTQGAANAPADAAGRPAARPPRRVFLGQPHVGWFVVTEVQQPPPRRESHIPGLFIVPYRVTLGVKEALPPVNQPSFVMLGSKGEGPEAGALGLEDWLPTTVGDECVLAFDPEQIGDAKQVVYLGSGPTSAYTWESAKRFYVSLMPGQGLDPARVAAAIGQAPPPRATFFQLLFAYDRSVYQDVGVVRALGAYLADAQVPALDRRTTVAHYLGQPSYQDAQALSELAGGMLQLALHLQGEGQVASAGVVLQRLYGQFFVPSTGAARIARPALNEAQRMALVQLLDSPEVALNADVYRSLMRWINP